MNSPSPAFVGRVLLVSNDAIAIEQLSESMQRFALFPERCPDVPSALARLNRTKFEAVIVDLRLGSQAGAVVEGARLSAASIDLSLKAAYGLIVRERRRYFRCPVEVPVAILRTAMQTVHGHTVNISEGGMSTTAAAPLGPGDQVRLHFTLPGDDFQFVLESTVCWAKERRLGFQFLSPHQTSRLQEWLSRRLEEAMPQSVRDKFSTLPPD